MTELEKARERIDSADREMARLFCERMDAVKTVSAYKRSRGLPVADAAREEAVIRKNSAFIEDEEMKPYYVTFIKGVMDVAKAYQRTEEEGLKVAYAGIEGAFAGEAAKRIFPDSRAVSYPDFKAAYDAVLDGSCDVCVLPIENSFAGEVGAVLDLMFFGSLYVNGVYELPVRQHLLGLPEAKLGDIVKVISHTQALAQCAEYIRERGFETEAVSNTAVAAKTVAASDDKTLAAIAGDEAARAYGLNVLDHDINSESSNTTRFAVFSRAARESAVSDEKFIMLFTVNNVVGALAKAVNVICAHGFNMSVLRSRPVKDVPWQYYFYVEAQGNHNSDEGQRMMKELAVCCDSLKIVGHYPAKGNSLK